MHTACGIQFRLPAPAHHAARQPGKSVPARAALEQTESSFVKLRSRWSTPELASIVSLLRTAAFLAALRAEVFSAAAQPPS